MSTDELNRRVTGAIWRAEQEHQNAPSAWAEVSDLEEKLAAALPVALAEGRIARRGAVRAAIKAQDLDRAQRLAERYLAEKDAPEEFLDSLRAILGEGGEPRARTRTPGIWVSPGEVERSQEILNELAAEAGKALSPAADSVQAIRQIHEATRIHETLRVMQQALDQLAKAQLYFAEAQAKQVTEIRTILGTLQRELGDAKAVRRG